MSPREIDDPQDLFQLIAQYGQDFPDFYATERAAFDDFASRPRDRRGAALAGLDHLLATTHTEADLGERLGHMAFAYVVQTGGSPTYRDFLLRLRGWLVESLEERPPGPVPEEG